MSPGQNQDKTQNGGQSSEHTQGVELKTNGSPTSTAAVPSASGSEQPRQAQALPLQGQTGQVMQPSQSQDAPKTPNSGQDTGQTQSVGSTPKASGSSTTSPQVSAQGQNTTITQGNGAVQAAASGGNPGTVHAPIGKASSDKTAEQGKILSSGQEQPGQPSVQQKQQSLNTLPTAGVAQQPQPLQAQKKPELSMQPQQTQGMGKAEKPAAAQKSTDSVMTVMDVESNAYYEVPVGKFRKIAKQSSRKPMNVDGSKLSPLDRKSADTLANLRPN
jgi:hypothetical protein